MGVAYLSILTMPYHTLLLKFLFLHSVYSCCPRSAYIENTYFLHPRDFPFVPLGAGSQWGFPLFYGF